MKCFNCNKFIPETSVYCPFCNQDLSKKPEVIDFGNIEDTDYDNKFDIKTYVKEPKNRKIVIGGVATILGVVIVFIFLIASLFTSTKTETSKMFTVTVETFFDYFIDNFTGSSSTKSGSYELEIVDNKKTTKFEGEYGIDTKNKIISLTGKMRDPREITGEIILDTRELIFSSYMKENELYFSSNQIYGNNQNILFPFEDNIGFLTTKNYDLGTVLSGLEYAIIDSLKVMEYKNKKEVIKYRGDERKLNKRFIVLDNAVKKKFYQKFYNTLLDDSNFLNEIARITDKSKEEIEKILKNYLTTAEYKYNGESKYTTTLAIYYKGAKIYRIEIDMDEEEKQKIIIDVGDTKYYFSYYKDNELVLSTTLVALTKEKETFINKTYEITYEKDAQSLDITLKIKDEKNARVKKQEITNYKNIRDFKEEDYNILKTNLGYYIKKVDWVDNLEEVFKNKCTPDLDCICDGDECNCTYENTIIRCNKSDITKKIPVTP